MAPAHLFQSALALSDLERFYARKHQCRLAVSDGVPVRRARREGPSPCLPTFRGAVRRSVAAIVIARPGGTITSVCGVKRMGVSSSRRMNPAPRRQ